MNKGLKSLMYQILYMIVLIGAVLGILGIIGSGVLAAACIASSFTTVNLSFNYMPFGNSVGVNAMIYITIIALLILAEKALFQARIKVRHHTDFDDDGMAKKFNSYDKLSAKEKAEFDRQKLMDTERLIDSATLRKITHAGSKDPEKDMSELIGLTEVKRKMHEMASRMAYEKSRHGKNKKKKNELNEQLSMHMCFIGPPGTGKTTCARIMAGFLYKYGYIKENKCIEVDGNFLKGGYKGETTEKTKLLIQKARNGVLFIDEAYALLENTGDGYGQEAIATIVKEMEDKRGEFVVIFAGYDYEMKVFVNSNPGIFSRIKHYLWFEPYSINDLAKIFRFMAKSEGYDVLPETIIAFKKRMSIEVNQNNFGNARSVRNCLEKAIDKHATNIMDQRISDEYTSILCPEDIEIRRRESDFFNT